MDPNDTSNVIVYAKGAPESIIQRCSLIMRTDGYEAEIEDEWMQDFCNSVVAH